MRYSAKDVFTTDYIRIGKNRTCQWCTEKLFRLKKNPLPTPSIIITRRWSILTKKKDKEEKTGEN